MTRRITFALRVLGMSRTKRTALGASDLPKAQPTWLENGQRASALRFTDERAIALLAALFCQIFIPGQLTNKTLRPRVAQFLNREHTCAQSYDLRRLRLKGLLVCISGTHSYRLTEMGSKQLAYTPNCMHGCFARICPFVFLSTPFLAFQMKPCQP